jgi:hypothetical protein
MVITASGTIEIETGNIMDTSYKRYRYASLL